MRSWNEGKTYFSHQDGLGTERMRTDGSGTVAATFFNLPFGDGQQVTTPIPNSYPAPQEQKFAMNEFDGDSNTFHAQFRNYNLSMGRWLNRTLSARDAKSLPRRLSDDGGVWRRAFIGGRASRNRSFFANSADCFSQWIFVELEGAAHRSRMLQKRRSKVHQVLRRLRQQMDVRFYRDLRREAQIVLEGILIRSNAGSPERGGELVLSVWL
jgi:hypothetical protein